MINNEIDLERERRIQIVKVAESWLGTPFIDNQGLKGCGVDCAYFLAKVYEEVGFGKVNIPPYSPQIYLHKRPDGTWDDTYLKTILKYAREIEESQVRPGDVILYQVARSYTHGGIIGSWPDKIIHPIKPHGVICSAAFEGFVKFRKHKFFTLFVEKTEQC